MQFFLLSYLKLIFTVVCCHGDWFVFNPSVYSNSCSSGVEEEIVKRWAFMTG